MSQKKAFTLIELLVVVAIIALLISILLPSLAKARELSKQTVCTSNVRSVGTSCYIYQEDNLGVFPTAPYRSNTPGSPPVVEYIGNMGGGETTDPAGPTGPNRDIETLGGVAGSSVVSTTRSLWLLVRSGSIVPKSFVCPSTNDTVDPTVDVATYYDFIGFGTSSYGYQVPYDDTNDCKPSADVDPRMVLVADRGPWSAPSIVEAEASNSTATSLQFFTDAVVDSAAFLYQKLQDENPDHNNTPEEWRLWNSNNHGGQGQGLGQSMLFPDAHANFVTKPIGGVDKDNIYTRIDPTLAQGDVFERPIQWGEYPKATGTPVYPGYQSLFSSGNEGINAFTDSLIWP